MSATAVEEQSQQPANSTNDGDLSSTSTPLEKFATTAPVEPTLLSPRLQEHSESKRGTEETVGDVARINELGLDAPSNKSQTVKPLDTIPLLADDAGQLPDTISKRLVAESRPDGARTIHLPPKQQQEERLNNLDSSEAHHTSQSVPQPHEEPEFSTTQPPKHGAARAEGDGILGPQMDVARTNAATGGSPFTPDEQLRLEEARSLQGQITNLHAEVSARQSPDVTIPKDTHSALNQTDEVPELAPQASIIESKALDNPRREQRNIDAASEISGLRKYAYPGFGGDVAKDITFSQRPPMRIDTELSQQADQSKPSSFKKPIENNVVTNHTPPDSATSAGVSQSSAQAQSPPERMTTRVSSGALRHKSVSEILGGIPKPVTPHTDKSLNERTTSDINRDAAGLQNPRSSVSMTSPDPATFRLRLNELKGKEKSKLSAVVFARKQPLQPVRHPDSSRLWESDVVEEKIKNPEYFYPLIHAQAASPPRAQLLNRLIGSASKTLTTANHYVDYHEQQDCRILSRIEQLQRSNRWSLRQLERATEPERPVVHWDVLLSQMKWLRTDFREERRWKIAAASSVANWCAQWVASSKEERVALQIRTQLQSPVREEASESAPTPDLVPSAEDDSSDAVDDEMENVDLCSGKAPAAIFSLAPDMFYFGLEKTPSAEKILQELPLYQPSFEVQQAALGQNTIQSDKEWKTALLPVSKFGEGKLVSHDEGPPRKRSRYDYADLDEDHYFSTDVLGVGDGTPDVRPEQDDVALFNPENKHIRDRIHAGHAFRPPSEHVMPSQSFFESRHSSQWTQLEDDELRRLVREYAYNWSLISSCLSVPSAFSSGAERRTPWECFERWIGLEGLPAEMAKTQYFRAYHARLQAAQNTHEAQQQLLQQQQGSNVPLRRRSTQPFTVDRRRNTKHVHLVNAMKNLARKREAVPKKAEKGTRPFLLTSHSYFCPLRQHRPHERD